MALTQYKDGGTHNISSTINDDMWVDYQSPGKQTVVNLLAGGIISAPYDLRGYNESKITISGGKVNDVLWAYDNSQILVIAGSVNEVDTYNNSCITFSGGSKNCLSGLFANDNSHVILLSGGSVSGEIHAYDSSQVIISGGSIGPNSVLYAQGNSRVELSSGLLGGDLYAYANSQVSISGGQVSGYLFANGSNQVIISGGSISGAMYANSSSQITLLGSNFAIDGIPIGFGEITSILGGYYTNDPFRTITGILANGDLVNNQFKIGNEASINLTSVPEPSSLVALGALVVPLVLPRRRKG